MENFFATKIYYSTSRIDDSFVDKYKALTESAQEIVLKKNPSLKDYLQRGNEKEYDLLNFDADRLNVNRVFLRRLVKTERICPIHNVDLKKMNVRITIERKSRGINLFICNECKRIYSDSVEDDENALISLGIPYEIIEWEDYLDEKK